MNILLLLFFGLLFTGNVTGGDPPGYYLPTYTNEFRVEEGRDTYPLSVSSIGDFNGDAFDDFVIGDPYADTDRGRVYLIYGSTQVFPAMVDLTNLDLTNLTFIEFHGPGSASLESVGYDIAPAGDVNNDTYADFLIGTQLQASAISAAYLIYGSPNPITNSSNIYELINLNNTIGIRITDSVLNPSLGRSVSTAGDFNNDGFDDILIGAPSDEKAYLIFGGPALTGPIITSDLDGTDGYIFSGIGSGDKFGDAIAGIGDVNNDGIDDILISAWQYSVPAKAFAGEVYLILGTLAPLANPFTVSALNGTNGFRLQGSEISGFAGKSVSSAGDFNGDGIPDFMIGAPNENGYFVDSGVIYLIFGSSSLDSDLSNPIDIDTVAADYGATLYGHGSNMFMGKTLASVGDVDGDGKDDIVIGGPGTETNGKVFLIYGTEKNNIGGPDLNSVDGRNGTFFIGGSGSHLYGMGMGGDFNNDGYSDFLLTSTLTSSVSGPSFLLFGASNSSSQGKRRDLATDNFVDCNIGMYQDGPAFINDCFLCPDGTYQEYAGQNQCLLCPLGEFSLQGVNPSCNLCPPGTFTDTYGCSSCQDCPPGSSSTSGQSSCSECAKGTFNDIEGGLCEPCSMGNYTSSTNSTNCDPCPVARYNDQLGQFECKVCPPGTANPDTGQITCTPCQEGSYSSQFSTECLPCQKGTYSDQTHTTKCFKCPRGTFSNSTGAQSSGSCHLCPPGFASTEFGSSECVKCKNPENAPLSGSTSCEPPKSTDESLGYLFAGLGITVSFLGLAFYRISHVSKKQQVIYRDLDVLDLGATASGSSNSLAMSRGGKNSKKSYSINCLSLDGGGIRGVCIVTMLQEFEFRLGTSVQSAFHLIGGTSTGGLLSLGLFDTSRTLTTLIELYKTLGSTVFSGNRFKFSKIFKQITGQSYYNGQKFSLILQQVFGTETLLYPDGESLNGDDVITNTHFPLVFAVASLSSVDPPEEFLFRTYTQNAHYSLSGSSIDENWKLWEAARATSAAPIFFKEYERGERLFADGALFHNNPARVVIKEARGLWHKCDFGVFLSLGTGKILSDVTDSSASASKSSLGWVKTLASIATNSNRAHKEVQEMLAPECYFRFSPFLPFEIPLDASSPADIEVLITQTESYLQKRTISNQFDVMCQRTCISWKSAKPKLGMGHPENSPKFTSALELHPNLSDIEPLGIVATDGRSRIGGLSRIGGGDVNSRFAALDSQMVSIQGQISNLADRFDRFLGSTNS